MTNEELLRSLAEILADLLGVDSVDLSMDTRREDVDGWDSLSYVNFIAVVEMRYGVKFRVSEMESFRNVGEIVHSIAAKKPAR
jgi:acyl carrier protein